MPKKLTVSDEAVITETTRKIKLVTDPQQVQLGLSGHLKHQGRQVLVIRGGDAASATAQVYFKFAAESDSSGKPFQISLKKRGLTHVSVLWGTPDKITGGRNVTVSNKMVPTCSVSY